MAGEVTYVAKITAAGTDYFVPYDDHGHEWIDEMGFHAPIIAWVMPREMAAAILTALGTSTGSAREVTVSLGDPTDTANYVVQERVVVIGDAPADSPQQRYLLLSDVRWYFTQAWAALDANVRRRLGDTRLLGNALTTGIVLADTIAYAPWSINNGTAYTWSSFKDAMLTYLTTARHGRPAISFVTDTFTVIDVPAQAIPETPTDAQGDLAAARAIESVPGASLRVSRTGVLHVCEDTPGAEESIVTLLGPSLTGHGDLPKVNRSGIRPDNYWRVYFDLELELRLTYDATATILDTDPYLIPVVKVPEQSVTIPAGTYYGIGTVASSRVVGQGSWIGQDEYFAAIGAPAGTALANITDDLLALHWFDGTLNQYMEDSSGNTDPVWVARMNAIMASYRTTFRVNPKAWERIRFAWTARASVWDPATGSRATSPVYCNYSYVPANPTQIYGKGLLTKNVSDRYTSSGLIADMKPTPFELDMIDEELGIFAVDRNATLKQHPGEEPAGSFEVSDATTPADLDGTSGAPQEIAAQTLRKSTGTGAWKLATVISVAPASPNDLRRLYEVRVDKATAATWAGLASTPTGYGPDVEKRSRLDQVRIPWQDDTGISDVTLGILGFSDSTTVIDTADSTAFATALSGSSVTAHPTSPITYQPINLFSSIAALAQSVAAADLLGKLDCRVGTKTVPGSTALVPIGTLRRVVHQVKRDSFVSFAFCVEPDHNQFRATDFLPAQTRAFVLQAAVTQR